MIQGLSEASHGVFFTFSIKTVSTTMELQLLCKIYIFGIVMLNYDGDEDFDMSEKSHGAFSVV